MFNLRLAKKLGLNEKETAIFKKLSTPVKVQDFLNTLGTRVVKVGSKTEYLSPREVLKIKKAHCIEGAFLAATAFWLHGREPVLMDLKAKLPDYDHVVALFKEGRYWGAASKTNHYCLRYRDPIYLSQRELAVTYFHEYFYDTVKRKTLVSFSKPFSLKKFGTDWVKSEGNLRAIAEKLDKSSHVPILPKGFKPRHVDEIEVRAYKLTEHPVGF